MAGSHRHRIALITGEVRRWHSDQYETPECDPAGSRWCLPHAATEREFLRCDFWMATTRNGRHGDGVTFGTFAIYDREPRSPIAEERILIIAE
jgi:hypothetical protein